VLILSLAAVFCTTAEQQSQHGGTGSSSMSIILHMICRFCPASSKAIQQQSSTGAGGQHHEFVQKLKNNLGVIRHHSLVVRQLVLNGYLSSESGL
jgi:hypothetical protein